MPSDHYNPVCATDAGPALPDLVGAYWERVRAFALRRLGDVGWAEDLAQETLRQVSRALEEGRLLDDAWRAAGGPRAHPFRWGAFALVGTIGR